MRQIAYVPGQWPDMSKDAQRKSNLASAASTGRQRSTDQSWPQGPTLWDWSVSEWDEFTSAYSGMQASMTHLIELADLRPYDRAIDLGAGTGNLSRLVLCRSGWTYRPKNGLGSTAPTAMWRPKSHVSTMRTTERMDRKSICKKSGRLYHLVSSLAFEERRPAQPQVKL